MSRYTIKNEKENRSLTYGWDHALGYFYDITDLTKNEDDSGFIIEEKSSFINRLSRNDFSELLIKWKAPHNHLLALSLDIPF